jgi:uncharacterized protein RhaS with RHS repeats
MPGSTRRTILCLAGFASAAQSAPAPGRLELRDANGRLLGWTAPRTGGLREARSASGRLLGTYDPAANTTRDAAGRLLYRGDALAALIICRG